METLRENDMVMVKLCGIVDSTMVAGETQTRWAFHAVVVTATKGWNPAAFTMLDADSPSCMDCAL